MQQKLHSFTRDQIVAIFSEWSANDVRIQRNGKVDAQYQTERFIDTALMLFGSEAPALTDDAADQTDQ